MLIPLTWLKNYVSVTLPAKELAHRLTMAGNEVGEIRNIGENWDKNKLLVGRVVEIGKHPNADRLTLPEIDLGSGTTATVVCGAPNLVVGQKIAFAKEGALLFNTKSNQLEELKTTKIRGVLSAGMICSELELGLNENHEGILVLDDSAPVGTPLVDYLGDTILNIDVTPNRPDCLSMLGVAHEVAALTDQLVVEPSGTYKEKGSDINEQVSISIEDPELCSRYAASVITGIKVSPSPKWLQDALLKAGQRPINNIVDITNYVMLEYGQPLHAFNLKTIRDKTIFVRTARPEEKLDCLDGELRTLYPPMLVIADSKNAIALAGVIGGANTGVGNDTTAILIESANFEPINTHITATSLRINSEASYRFERGIRPELVPLALKRATKLVLKYAGGQAASGIVDRHSTSEKMTPVKITRKRIKQVLGLDLPVTEVEKTLASLGFECIERNQSSTKTGDKNYTLSMKIPYWRSDISIENDLIEEIARIIGYDKIPTTMLSTTIPQHLPNPSRELRERTRNILASSGMQEVISYPLTDSSTLEMVSESTQNCEPLRLSNPLNSEMQYLRTSLRGSLLKTLAFNRQASQNNGIRLFEIGRVYIPKNAPNQTKLPDEKEMLVGVLSGSRSPTSWIVKPNEMDFFDAKGYLELIFSQIGLEVQYKPFNDPTMKNGTSAAIVCNDITLGVVGELHSRLLEKFNLDQSQVAMFEVDLEFLYKAVPKTEVRHSNTSRFPESERDLALIVNAVVPSDKIQSIIQQHDLVTNSSPFDIYVGREIPAGKKSIGYRITFQSNSATLTTDQVENAKEDILHRLNQEVGAELRTQ